MKTTSISNEDLIREYVATGDEQIREKLFRSNDKLCRYTANKFRSTGYYPDDLLSTARFGMLKAFNSFDVEKGTKFATYATRCMHNEINMLIRRNKKHSKVSSINERIAGDDMGHELTYMDIVEDDSSQDIHKLEQRETIMKVLPAIKEKLTLLETAIFENNLKEEPLTQREVAIIEGLSQSYVSRVADRLSKKIRKLALKLQLVEGAEYSGIGVRKAKKKADSSESTKQAIEETPVTVYNSKSLQKDKGAGNMQKDTTNYGDMTRKILYFYLKRKDLKQVEVAKILNTSQGAVSMSFKKFKNMSKEKLATIQFIDPTAELERYEQIEGIEEKAPEPIKKKEPAVVQTEPAEDGVLEKLKEYTESSEWNTLKPSAPVLPIVKTVISLNLDDANGAMVEGILHNLTLPKDKNLKVALLIVEQPN